MSESSRSKPDEYDSTTDYHHLKFENRCLRGSGDDFQKLFEDIMVRARPREFERVRPYGRFGDRKCDGLIESEGIIFQVYSPDELKQAKVQKKIDKDLEGAVQDWSDILKKWVFVYNAKRGTSSDIKLTLQQKQKQYPDIEIDSWSNDYLWEITRELSLQQRSEILGLSPSSIAKTEQTLALLVNNQEHEANWHDICRGMLDRQIQFPTLNDLMAKDGVRIDPALFVPVGLVERKQKQYQRSDLGSAEQGSQLLQPTEEEIVKRFDNEEDFFSQVICNSDISNHSRLVITGEPGAGKTTLLQKIGDRLCQAGMFPIWFSLGKSGVLPTYEFLSRVLKENAQPRNFESSNWDASINALLQTGKVWLLLDGADEFTTNGNPLHVIGAQLREAWANQVKIVLTCRLNAWDTHALPEFKVFRTLGFDYRTPVDGYSNQVEAYIYRFFTKDGVDPQLGNTLIQQLHLPGKERIRDSVKNPLRLSLLCYVWESGIGELPDTKAELYRIFVDYYYDLQELKHPEISIDRTERDTLNLALGEVAKAALDSHDSRFRLRKSLIETIPTMGKGSVKDSLFDKAIRLDWLNLIGTTAEKPYEAAYAFLHPTFQEYFAALAIDDWDYFLPRTHESSPAINAKDKCKYRIFEAQWQEVILIWLGRNDFIMDSEQKEDFIEALINFQDGCAKENVYNYKSYFLAVVGTSEHKTRQAYRIIEQVFQWGWFCDEIVSSIIPPLQYARLSILNADREIVSEILVEVLHSDVGRLQIDAAKLTRNLNVKRTEVIEALFDLMNNSSDARICCETAFTLAKVCGRPEAMDTLINSLQSREASHAAQFLEELKIECPEIVTSRNPEIIKALEESIGRRPSYSPDGADIYIAAYSLLSFESSNEVARRALKSLSSSSFSIIRDLAGGIIEKLDPDTQYPDTQFKASSEELEFQPSCYEILKHQLEDLRIDLATDIMQTVNSLVDLICSSSDESIRGHATWCLERIVNENLVAIEACLFPQIVSRLRACFDNFEERNDPRKIIISFVGARQEPHIGCSRVLWHCAENMSYPDFYRAWHSSAFFTSVELPVCD